MRIEVKNLAEPTRIAKYLAQAGIVSRRKAEELILSAKIKIDGVILNEPGHKISEGQIIEIVNHQENYISIMMNKPISYVSAQAQNGEIPAIVLAIPLNNADGNGGDYSALKIPALGRLDKDSHGLLILSNDGVLAKNIIAHESDTSKEYIVKIKGVLNDEKIAKLRFGLSLDGRKLKRAIVEKIGDCELKFILKEGRNRQIRRMCAMLGLDVIDLKRTKIGALSLGNLKPKQWRHLTKDEINSFKPKQVK